MLLQNIAQSIVRNNPEVFLIVLLIDERPEEVTEMGVPYVVKSLLQHLMKHQHVTYKLQKWSLKKQNVLLSTKGRRDFT